METNDRPGSWAFQLALCLLGPIFFLSYFFLFAPLPALYLYVGTPERTKGTLWAITAVILGCALTAMVKGITGSILFLLIVGIPALVIGELLLRKKGVEKAIAGACAAVIFVAFTAGLIQSRGNLNSLYNNAYTYAQSQAKVAVEFLLKQSKDNSQENSDEYREELEKISNDPSPILAVLPGTLLTSLLLLCILPCLAIVRWNPKGFLRRAAIPRDFLRKWKAPDWLLIPSLLTVGFLLVEVDYLSIFASNFIIVILLIYFFQGMSIVAYFLDLLRWRGVFRVLVYMAGVFFSPPSFIMVVSFGFFDFWFNFRERNRNPEQNEED